jgi:hypothetical protein
MSSLTYLGFGVRILEINLFAPLENHDGHVNSPLYIYKIRKNFCNQLEKEKLGKTTI